VACFLFCSTYSSFTRCCLPFLLHRPPRPTSLPYPTLFRSKAIQERFDNLDYLYDLGDISLNISGCINSCGHHHVGNIGVLGVDKDGEEWYQITLGGEQGNDAAIGKVIGPSFDADEIPDVMTRIMNTYVAQRDEEESFIETYRRLGVAPFKEAAYLNAKAKTQKATAEEAFTS